MEDERILDIQGLFIFIFQSSLVSEEQRITIAFNDQSSLVRRDPRRHQNEVSMMSTRFYIDDFLTNFLHYVNNPVLKGFYKFPFDMPINQYKGYGLSKSIKSTYISIVTIQQKILQLLWPITLFSFVQLTSNSVEGHIVWSYMTYKNLGQINHNLNDDVLMTFICKPPIHVTFVLLSIKRKTFVLLLIKRSTLFGTPFIKTTMLFYTSCIVQMNSVAKPNFK